ncbi:MAG: family 14 glycosylhydrolase [Bacteroidota bacterium]
MAVLPLNVFGKIKGHRIFNVMAPLHIKVYHDNKVDEPADWAQFEAELKAVKAMGVEAVTVDVWWGDVQAKSKNQYDWSYYDRLLGNLEANGLQFIPILSFHQCGGNINDNYTSLLPAWLWEDLAAKDPQRNANDFFYVSEEKEENGERKVSKEYIAHWADEYAMPYYKAFMIAFKEHFADKVHLMPEINVSLGPSGELRYPAYNAHDSGDFPNRGRLQCYSPLAVQHFRQYIRSLYFDLDGINKAWSTQLTDIHHVTPPADPEEFFTSGAYHSTTYGRDFIRWYHGSLVKHGHRMVDLASEVFKDHGFEKPKIGIKVPGIHWQISNPKAPRTAEITAGLINADENLFEEKGSVYLRALDQLIPQERRDRVTLHFTCLEMNELEDQKVRLPYSTPKRLVGQVGRAALVLGIQLKGENALGFLLQDKSSWKNMRQALIQYPFQGITFLRIGEVAHAGSIGNRELKKLIQKCRPAKRKGLGRFYFQE